MKAFTQKTFGEKAYSEVIHGIQSNKALLLIAMSRYLGFKEKRMNDFINFLDDIENEFSGYEKDGISEEKISAELKECGINSNRIYEPIPTLSEVNRAVKCNKKTVSFKEAQALTEQMSAMREFLMEGQNAITR